MEKKPIIEFQYFDGCPNSKATLENLKKLIIARFIKEYELQITNIPNINYAEELNFQGSPSILIDGYDIYSEKKPDSYNYSCRLYNISGKLTGVLTTEYIKKQIEKIRS